MERRWRNRVLDSHHNMTVPLNMSSNMDVRHFAWFHRRLMYFLSFWSASNGWRSNAFTHLLSAFLCRTEALVCFWCECVHHFIYSVYSAICFHFEIWWPNFFPLLHCRAPLSISQSNSKHMWHFCIVNVSESEYVCLFAKLSVRHRFHFPIVLCTRYTNERLSAIVALEWHRWLGLAKTYSQQQSNWTAKM